MNHRVLHVSAIVLMAAISGCGASVSEIKGKPPESAKGGPSEAQQEEMKNKMMEMQKRQAQQRGETQEPPGSK